MVLVPCRECRREISSIAPSCPHCGIENPGHHEPVDRQERETRPGKEWYYRLRASAVGPHSLEYMKILTQNGTIKSDTLVRKEGEDWTQARNSIVFKEVERSRSESSTGPAGCLVVGTAVLLVLVAVFLCDGSETQQTGSTQPEAGAAWVMCQDWVKERLVAPSTADFPWGYSDKVTASGRQFTVRAYVDSENRMGGKIRADFVCVTEYLGSDRWRLIDLQIESR